MKYIKIKFHESLILLSLACSVLLLLVVVSQAKKIKVLAAKLAAASQKLQTQEYEIYELKNPTLKITGQKKNIKVDKRSYDLKIYFKDYQKHTYNHTVYKYMNKTFVIYELNDLFNGSVQPLGADSEILNPIVYEGRGFYSIEKLQQELQQPPGMYSKYEILVNKNGIKMKKSIAGVPGYSFVQYEFIEKNRYYSFLSQSKFKTEVDQGIDPYNLKAMQPFIDSIELSPY